MMCVCVIEEKEGNRGYDTLHMKLKIVKIRKEELSERAYCVERKVDQS